MSRKENSTFTIRFLLILVLCFTTLQPAISQNAPTSSEAAAPTPPKRELRYNLNESGSLFFQATFLNQVWLRYNQSNPGTLVQDKPQDETFDIGLRRTRIQLFGQITERAFLYFQFGQNNFNALYNSKGNRKIAAFFHDATCEYRVTNNNAIKLGAGLTVANGLSRFTQPSVVTALALDVPVFAQATVDQTDQFNRKLSLYARGQINKIDYRIALSDPFPITSNGNPAPAIGPNATFAQIGHNKQYQAYLTYNFFEMESHTTPYMAGTYLGKKKVFNIGGGIIFQENATWSRDLAADTLYHNMLLWSAEAFLDLPLNQEKGTALTAYLGYFNYDFGPNYLRYNGLMNPANGSRATNQITGAGPTFGNAMPMFGTGNIQHAEAAYLLPHSVLGTDNGQLQPFAAYTRSTFDRLGRQNTVDFIDIGSHWLIRGHNAKVSLGYQNRPTFELNATNTVTSGPRKNALILQYQLFI